jgi:hypothetical protein
VGDDESLIRLVLSFATAEAEVEKFLHAARAAQRREAAE